MHALSFVISAFSTERVVDLERNPICRWNCVTFAVNLLATTLLLNLLSGHEVIGMISPVRNLPIFRKTLRN